MLPEELLKAYFHQRSVSSCWKEILLNQLVENTSQMILVVTDKIRLGISLEPRTYVAGWVSAFFFFIIWMPACIAELCPVYSTLVFYCLIAQLKKEFLHETSHRGLCTEFAIVCVCLFNCLVPLAPSLMLFTRNSTPGWSLCFISTRCCWSVSVGTTSGGKCPHML